MYIFFVLLFTLIGFIMSFVVKSIEPIPETTYINEAKKGAIGAFYVNNTIPSSVDVMGRTINIDSSDINISNINMSDVKNINRRRVLIEQALINTCLTLQATCGRNSNNLVWAFLENNSGLISNIWNGPIQNTINCATATQDDYARYGKWLIRSSIHPSIASPVMLNGVNRNFYYSRPQGYPIGGNGCSFKNIVEIR